MKGDFDRIKKYYGEKFAKDVCRAYLSQYLDDETFSLADYLTRVVAPSKAFYADLIDHNQVDGFVAHIIGELTPEEEKTIDVDSIEPETPEELMRRAGYTLTRCETKQDVLNFKKYYKQEEVLCTYKEIQERLDSNEIFWAVKDGAENIQGAEEPQREDEYGLSVLSIQFNKEHQTLSKVICRYNHTGEFNPDCTFRNDLDKLCPGLRESFQYHYGLGSVTRDEWNLPGYEKDREGRMHKCNVIINGIAYCPGNVVIVKGEFRQYDLGRFIIADYFTIDRQKKTITLLDPDLQDSFVSQFTAIDKIEVSKNPNGDGRKIVITQGDKVAELVINSNNQIVSFTNTHEVEVGDNFMHCSNVGEVNMPNLVKVGNAFLMDAPILSLDFPNLQEAGDEFCSCAGCESVDLRSLISLGDGALECAGDIERVNMPELVNAGERFVTNAGLLVINTPKLVHLGVNSLEAIDGTTDLQIDMRSLNRESRTNLPKRVKRILMGQRFMRAFGREQDLSTEFEAEEGVEV